MTESSTEGETTGQIHLKMLNLNATKVILKLTGVRHSRRSFSVRFFVNAPDADAKTPIRENDRFGGTFFMYGHGMPGEDRVGEEAVLEGYVPEAGKVLEPFDALVDITEATLPCLKAGDTDVRVSFVVVDEAGEALPLSTFKFDEALLETR